MQVGQADGGAVGGGEIVDVQEQVLVASSEQRHQLVHGVVLAERVVVEMPDVRRTAEGCCGGLPEIADEFRRSLGSGGRGVAKGGYDAMGKGGGAGVSRVGRGASC